MLNKMYEILNVNNMESAITKANIIQRDMFCFGMATQYTEEEVIASEFILDYVLVQQEEESFIESNYYEYM